MADIDPAIFDAGLMAAVKQLIPSERLHEYLRVLDLQFEEMVSSASSDATLRVKAHKIVSQAGMLGLTRMLESARQVEEACRTGNGQEAALRNCCEAIADIRLYAVPAARTLPSKEPAFET